MDRLKKFLEHKFGLRKDQWEILVKHLKRRDLAPGEFFIKQHEVGRNSGFILNGVARYFCYDANGNDPTGFFRWENQYIIDPYTFKTQSPQY